MAMVLAVAACSRDRSASGSNAGADARAAIRNTLALDHYSVHVTIRADDGDVRYRIDTTKSAVRARFSDKEAIAIGEDYFQSGRRRNPKFEFERIPSKDAARSLVDLSYLLMRGMLNDADFRPAGSAYSYSFRNPRNPGRGRLTVDESRVSELTSEGGTLPTYVYKFDYSSAAPSITPPPESMIVPAPTPGPTCGPDGEPPPGLAACTERMSQPFDS